LPKQPPTIANSNRSRFVPALILLAGLFRSPHTWRYESERNRPIVIFQSDLFDNSWPSTSDANWPPAGKDAALFFLEKLVASGFVALDDSPFIDKDGWLARLRWGDNNVYAFVVHWAAIGEPPEDYWVVQTAKEHQGFIQYLRWKKATDETLPICNILREIIKEQAGYFSNVRWLSMKEFCCIY
jgi:hypothetical protein